MDDLEEKIKAARGEGRANLLLKNANLINVLSGEIYPADVAIYGDTIVGIGHYEAEREIDLGGKFLCPGFIDAHVHIESSMVIPPEYARAVVPRGTTSVISDPHEIANVMGIEGITLMAEMAEGIPLNTYIMLPSCVPATEMETSGARLDDRDLEGLRDKEWALGLGEVMDFPGVIRCNPDMLEKIEMARGKPIDGHCPGLTGKDLAAYITAGIRSDHECTNLEEAREKLRNGMAILIREGSMAKNLEDLLPLVTPATARRCLFASDDRHPDDLMEEGHLDFILRKSVSLGLSPIIAIQMATINVAEAYGLRDVGTVAPGFRADLVVLDDLTLFIVDCVFKDGKLVARGGKMLAGTIRSKGMEVGNTIHVRSISPEDLAIRAQGRLAKIIEIIPGQLVTKALVEPVPIRDGKAEADPERDILKVAVFERHTASGNIGLGFVRGFGVSGGAIGSSVAHDAHNIVVVGDNDIDMATAAANIAEMGDGLVIVQGGRISASLALPLAGLMSDKGIEHVVKRLKLMRKMARDMGCKLEDPFMALAFLSLTVIPELRVTDRGLVDVGQFRIVPLFGE
ncbi:MAG: adenine deaminase [Deltaproteobacteria bacterium]|nr:adenine deaminase [Deltaproteobacteria bacterium]